MKNRVYAPRIPERIKQPNEMVFFEYKRFWRHHQENFASLVLLQGISIKTYAELYRLDLRLTYIKFQPLGAAALRRRFWEQHRQQYQTEHAKTGIAVEVYIQAYKLHHKTAQLELKRQPMSKEWAIHCRRYEWQYDSRGITIAQYAVENDLNPSTARRYIRRK
ncbi:hypothetical protein [Aeromonas sp. sif2416]|uniref:hypothetical protein n=1 Tax=Aeromonas sp. sif2416 TaxID=2854793 RepID=UPI001C485EEC|nr:hypothetical protein [Aeromonas sp. sif2416]MBV7437094.1 hypothetical protein [Aeromonas sp. sif2416]